MLYASSLRVLISAAALTLTAYSQATSPATGVESKSTTAVGYVVGGGDTKVDMKGTSVLPTATGEAKVKAEKGITDIELKLEGLSSPTKLGTEFLTYVLWAVSTEGRTSNLGEIIVDKNGKGQLNTTSQLQTFSLIVTAEPYFSVRMPSEMVVSENETRKNTKGTIFPGGKYQLMRRAQYEKQGNPLALSLDLKNVPLEMYQARNAVEIAKSRQSDKYAPEIMTKADASLKMAENALASKANKKEITSTARQSVQFAEDARALSVQRQNDERIASEKAAAVAKAKADAEAKAAAEAAAAKQKADAAAAAAKQKADSEAAAASESDGRGRHPCGQRGSRQSRRRTQP